MKETDYGGSDYDSARERRKIIVRIGIAVAIIVALLAFVLIREQGNEPASTEQASSSPDIGVAVTSASQSAIPEDVQKAIAEAPDATQTALAPAASAPATLSASAPASDATEGTLDPSVKPILDAPPLRTMTHSSKEAHTDRVVVESGRSAPAPSAVSASSSAHAVPVVPPPAQPASAQTLMVTPTPAFPSGTYAVQLGVFSNVSNAEELREKIKQAGIPAQLETRVQVGPFPSRAEALRAQDKLRTLGLGKGMLVVAGKKP